MLKGTGFVCCRLCLVGCAGKQDWPQCVLCSLRLCQEVLLQDCVQVQEAPLAALTVLFCCGPLSAVKNGDRRFGAVGGRASSADRARLEEY